MYSYSVKVDKGIYEESNDDRALVGQYIVEQGEISGVIKDDFMIASICDGVGGLEQGGRAASTTLEVIKYLNRPDVKVSSIKASIKEANKRIEDIKRNENLFNGMCTTIAGIYAYKDNFFIFNIGDSRVYRFRYKYLMQLSHDHSEVQDLIDLGKISMSQAKDYPKKNVITRYIGEKTKCIPRIIEMPTDFIEKDIILICSDGISDVLSEDDLKNIIIKYKDMEDLNNCRDEIYDMAIKKGSLDNLSIVLLRKE